MVSRGPVRIRERQGRLLTALVDVAHIEDKVGPHGGAYWLLTLSCGHFKAVRQPRYPAGMLPVAHRGNVKQERRQQRVARMSTFLAPRRVKCLMGCRPEAKGA